MKMLSAALALSLMLGIESDAALVIEGIELPDRQGTLKLNGAGLLRKGFFFRIYVGALYTESATGMTDSLAEQSKQIDIHYFHHTPKKHMIRVAEKTLKKNLSPKAFSSLSPKIVQLHDAFLDGEKGSVASITHVHGTGLVYRFDHKTIITIPGDDFANAYFSVWLGEHPSSPSIKKAMLGEGD